jgi:hypothetical protein
MCCVHTQVIGPSLTSFLSFVKIIMWVGGPISLLIISSLTDLYIIWENHLGGLIPETSQLGEFIDATPQFPW